MKRNLILLILAMSIISAGLSPACKFISGESTLIEICTAFGVKNITLPMNDGKNSGPAGHKLTDQCAYCFASQNHKYIIETYKFLEPPIAFTRQEHEVERQIYLKYRYSHYRSTGPPYRA